MILLDNIIFELQSQGGITNVWKAVVKQAVQSEMNIGFLGVFPEEEMNGKNDIQIFPDLKLPLYIRRYLDVSRPKSKIFHSSYFRVCRSKATKNVVTVHDFTYEKFDKGLRQKVHLYQKKRALHNADAIICISENTKKDLLDYHPEIDSNIISVIYNGFDDEVFYPVDKDTSHDNYFLSVGGRNIHKNFDFTLHLMQHDFVKKMGTKLLIVGGGPMSDEHKGFIEKHGLTSKIEHRLGVSDQELNLLYNRAMALIYPSYYEGFGIPPLEALAAGCPVISSDNSSLPEVLGDCGLYIEVDDSASAIPHIRSLQDSQFRSQLIKRGFVQAANFSWEKTGQQTLDVYKNLLQKG